MEQKENKKVGRKPMYETTQLLDIIETYKMQNPTRKLRISELVKFSDIPRYIWRDNLLVKERIKEYNTLLIQVDGNELDLPAAEEIVNKSKNREELIDNIQKCLDISKELFDKLQKQQSA